jgi:GMP synthase (glutamine-hydrolysing)
LGAKVGFHSDALVEIGYYPLKTTAEGRHFGGFPEQVYEWHREGFELPCGARLLATSDGAFPNQAFLYGPNAFAVQFHPEITLAQVHRWTGHNLQRLGLKGARQQHEHIDGHETYGPLVRGWLDAFLSRWVRAGVAAG